MGRKTLKSVQKLFRRREERKQFVDSVTLVRKANQLKDPLEDFPAFRTFTNNGLTVTFECKKVKQLELSLVEWILKLEKSNMEKLYNECDWGWDEEKKNSEMTEDSAWYLIAYTPERIPVAFSHFRFDMDFDERVLYCYEIQLEPDVRRHKLGKFMMQVLELIAFKNQMKKLVLTVFKHNPSALDFFKSLNYSLDSTSPTDVDYCYLILSKINRRLINNTVSKS